jgi:glycine/D-amino acid oxidase-like deaminating enzyme
MNIWEATARQAAPQAPALDAETRADVVIVGGGYTGLATALALAERGAGAVLLEARDIGFGASGRNGGQVIPGLKLDPQALDRLFGEATTSFVGAAADVLFALVERLGLDCGAMRSGWIQATLKEAHLPAVAARVEQWRQRGAAVEPLDEAAVGRLTGARGFVGGWRDARAGVVHPLDYVRGLATAAQGAGARLHAGSPVERLAATPGGWRVTTAAGAVQAGRVVIATNGYSDRLWPSLEATALPARSRQIATAPLAPALLEKILPGGEAVSDTRRVGNYFRIGPQGRLIFGGRGSFRRSRATRDYADLHAALAELYPEAADAPIEFSWGGRVAMTADHLPHLYEPAPGLIAVLGYNGRGVAMATALGLAIGAHLADPAQPLPLRASEMNPLPLHALHPIYGEGAILYNRLRDALES